MQDAGAVPVDLIKTMKRAMEHRDKVAVKNLIAQGYKVSGVLYSDTRETALHHAARYHEVDMCQIFIDAGARVNAKDKYKATPLDTAFEQGRPADVIAALVQAGADVSRFDRHGWRALHQAASRDDSSEKKMFQADVCQAILDGGADLFATTSDGQTALHLVHTLQAWQFFVDAGISPDYVDPDAGSSYLTPFQSAVERGLDDIVAYCVAQGTVDLDQRTFAGKALMDLSFSSGVRSALRSGKLVEDIAEAIGAGAVNAKPVIGRALSPM